MDVVSYITSEKDMFSLNTISLYSHIFNKKKKKKIILLHYFTQ